MTVRFSSAFKRDLLEAETRYSAISQKLGDDFHTRIKEAVRTIIVRRGGDHAGPHGYRCRKCRPFPYLVYYELDGDNLFVLGLVQERKGPRLFENRTPEIRRKVGESGSRG